jgi:hypothetical protein
MLILQRTLTEFIEPRYAALPMGEIGRMVPLLPIGHDVDHCRGIEYTPGQDTTQQHLHLGEGQGWGFFFNLRHARTRKPWARIQSVI